MFEKVNPCHPDKVADRIAGALVDLAYKKAENPRIAVEVLIGHGVCHIIADDSVSIPIEEITAAIHRAAGTVGLRLITEVVPLAGYGIAMGGKLDGRAFISKGGMVGDENAMVTCVKYLQEHIV